MSLAIVSATLAFGSPAFAEPDPDTVFLNGGGRVRGTISVDDPKEGITIVLTYGSVRHIKHVDVERVVYGAAGPAPVAPTHAPAPSAPSPPHVLTDMAATAPAVANDLPDTVMLANGGRLRGVVMEEDPQTGVSIKLPDSTTKHLRPAEVKQVRYGSAPAPQAATPVGPVAPSVQPPPAGILPAMSEARVADPEGGQPGLAVRNTGVVLFSLGLPTAVIGATLVGIGCSFGQGCSGINWTVPAPLLGVGGALLLTGVLMWPIGQSRMDRAAARPDVSLGAGPAGSYGGSLMYRF